MKYLIVGDALIDLYTFGIVNRQSPEDPTIPIIDYVGEEIRLGGALNVAANVRSLSHKFKDQVYISTIMSSFTSELLKEKDISYDAIVLEKTTEPHERELVKTRICHSETHQQFLRIDNRLKFDEGDIQRYKNKCYYYNGKEFDCIIVSDYNKGIIDKFIINKLNEVSCPVFVDTKNKDLSIWNNIPNAFIKINNKEYFESENNTNHPLIITQGKNGAILTSPGGEISFPTVEIVNGNVIGAGDVYIAALAVNYMETGILTSSIEYANKAAGVSVKKYGTCAVKREEIK